MLNGECGMVNGRIRHSPFNIRHSAFVVLHRAHTYPCLSSSSRVSTGSPGDAEEAEEAQVYVLLRFLRVTRLLFSEARTQCREALRFFVPEALAARAGALPLAAFLFQPGFASAVLR